MNYIFTNTMTGDTPTRSKRIQTAEEVENTIQGFLAFNPTRKKFATLDDKIKHYNKNSFYTFRKAN